MLLHSLYYFGLLLSHRRASCILLAGRAAKARNCCGSLYVRPIWWRAHAGGRRRKWVTRDLERDLAIHDAEISNGRRAKANLRPPTGTDCMSSGHRMTGLTITAGQQQLHHQHQRISLYRSSVTHCTSSSSSFYLLIWYKVRFAYDNTWAGQTRLQSSYSCPNTKYKSNTSI